VDKVVINPYFGLG
nr:Chain W, KRIT1 NPxY/F3 [Homo sapiens]4WJ7_X Chain X, KRIT1 NPxY/F3 [Homo sapiens]4WJ7_Y Chain Y, KRIT1 NPxY/F3 [Homo sapiens]4WJ7_Z Chain Z, KRIT1 NPxY/F3 [Homo sapiens]